MTNRRITIVGINGSQGGSVARHFQSEPGWMIRGITRNINNGKSKAWIDEGLEVVEANLDDQASLERAFEGSHAIFVVTDYASIVQQVLASESLLSQAQEQGLSPEAYAGVLERAQGINAANAAATPAVLSRLERFVFSTLPAVLEPSNGKYRHVYEFDAKAGVEDHIRQNLPGLLKRLSTVTMGNYLENWQYIPAVAPQKESDGSYSFLWPDIKGKHVDHPELWVTHEAGLFVKSLVLQQPVGTQALAANAIISVADYATKWGKVMGVPAQMKVVSEQEYAALIPESLRTVFLELVKFVTEYGLGGLRAAEQLGIEPTPIEEFIKSQNWNLDD